tara:strand:+ start:88 stop:426 length:339 start_codon:yes stop_codon:yes gene_type:complete
MIHRADRCGKLPCAALLPLAGAPPSSALRALRGPGCIALPDRRVDKRATEPVFQAEMRPPATVLRSFAAFSFDMGAPFDIGFAPMGERARRIDENKAKRATRRQRTGKGDLP